MNEDITPSVPRVVALTGAPHPQALIQSVEASTGLCVFAWLNAAGERVDSGGSIAQFTPAAPLPPVEGASLDAPLVYPDPTDDVLASAISNPPVPVLPVPASVTQRQLRLHLLTLGVTDAAVRAQLAGSEAALIEWEYADLVKREHPLVATLGSALGLNSDQIDAAFRAAAEL